MTEGTEGQGSERRPIRVAIREEDLEDVRGQGWRLPPISPEGTDDTQGHLWGRGLGQTEEDVEGQVYVMSVHRKGDPDDTKGQSYGHGLDPVGDDVGGQGVRWNLRPADVDEVQVQRYKRGNLKPAEDGTWSLELDDDTEGHGGWHP